MFRYLQRVQCQTRSSAFYANATATRSAIASFSASASLGSDTDSKLGKLHKVLVANRGEIACRVMRTARRLGIPTVAVYSEADKHSMHVKSADEAILIGKPPATESYLKGDTIIDVCRRTGANAVHPGYGFLSENADFAKKLAAANLTFIGPPVDAIVAMGSKSESKTIMENANVPCVPGYHGEDQSHERMLKEADRIGYPILLKAWLGGGGKGMRIVHSKDELVEALQSAQREAKSSFGDANVLLEKYIERPRHIELQVFADTHGNVVYLFERDCSLQRRYQKVIEEAPAPNMDEALRKRMGEAACNAARAVGYVGAGTVEFIFDTDTDEFYFMEMNTRLQVEHPVTEMVTGQDLVEWQLRVAAGQRLPLLQDELKLNGHAFETRVYAESPRNNFLPQTGKLVHLSAPAESENVRVDTGVRHGDEVSIYYDPMIAKLITWDVDRDAALRRMKRALGDYEIVGVPTNIEFCRRVCDHEEFVKGNVNTSFIPTYIDSLLPPPSAPPNNVLALAALAIVADDIDVVRSTAPDALASSAFAVSNAARLNSNNAERRFEFVDEKAPADADEVKLAVTLAYGEREGEFSVHFEDGSVSECAVNAVHAAEGLAVTLSAQLGDQRVTGNVVKRTDKEANTLLTVFLDQEQYDLRMNSKKAEFGSGAVVGADSMVAPMPGKIMEVFVAVGDTVKAGDKVISMEAMKMEHTIRAPRDGVIAAVFFGVGDLCDKVELVALEAEE